MKPLDALRRFVHEAVKTKEEERELSHVTSFEFDVDAAAAQELATRVYEQDIAMAFQAKILKQEHHPAKDPVKDWGVGTAVINLPAVNRVMTKMSKKKPTP